MFCVEFNWCHFEFKTVDESLTISCNFSWLTIQFNGCNLTMNNRKYLMTFDLIKSLLHLSTPQSLFSNISFVSISIRSFFFITPLALISTPQVFFSLPKFSFSNFFTLKFLRFFCGWDRTQFSLLRKSSEPCLAR